MYIQTNLVHTDRNPPMKMERAVRTSTVLSALAPPFARPARKDLYGCTRREAFEHLKVILVVISV